MDSAVFDGINLNTGHYAIDNQTPDFGSQAIADALLTGQYRVEEYDQAAAGRNLTRTVTLPLQIRSGTPDALVTDQQALTASLAGANRFVPKAFTWTPNGSSHVSNFRVFGGSWVPSYDQIASQRSILRGTLTLICDWPVRGAVQSLGSSGSPLVTNATSPASVTLAPSPVGDVPGDVTVFAKNRDAAAIRSLLVAGISQNTTWTAGSAASTWTADTNGTYVGPYFTVPTPDATTVRFMAHFTAPTLPADRRFRVYLRAAAGSATGGSVPPSMRVRVVSGQTEVIGPWRTMAAEQYATPSVQPTWTIAFDMGAYTFPVGGVGDLGAQSTTVYIEARGNDATTTSTYVHEALFVPDDSTLVVETSDTTKTIAAASGIIRVESDNPYDASGNPVGGAVIGANIRTLGGRYTLYASKGYMGTLDMTIPWAPANVDVWATHVPRFVGLA